MTKILIIAESIDVEDSSGSKANVALIKNLSLLGFQIRVYHYTRKEIELEGIACFSLSENRHSLLFFLSRLERHIRYITAWNLNRWIELFLGFSFTLFNDRNSIIKGLKKIKDFNPDLVLTLSKGGSFRPHHALLKIPQWHSKWIAYIHDPYPMHAYPRPYDYVETGHEKKHKFIWEVAKKAKYAAYPSKILAEWMESYFKPFIGKAIIIPHQIEKESTIKANLPFFFDPNKFSVVHAGNLLWGRNPEGLVKAFLKLVEDDPEFKEKAKLYFIGSRNHYSKELEKVSREHDQIFVSNDYVSFLKVQKIQKTASVNVILEAKGPVSPFLPGKFPHCIAARKPILLLGPFYSESKRLLGDEYPFSCEIDDVNSIYCILLRLFTKWQEADSSLEMNYDNQYKYLSFPYLQEVFKKLTI